MNTYWNDGTELYHYGILGQKWGVRRYQNPDGSYTDEGRRHYGIGTRRPSSAYMRMEEKRRTAFHEKQDTKTDAEIKRLSDKANALAAKYDFDADDGGGGSNTASRKAGERYMQIWDKVSELELQREERANKAAVDEMIKKYGKEAYDNAKFTQNFRDAEKATIAILGGFGGIMYGAIAENPYVTLGTIGALVGWGVAAGKYKDRLRSKVDRDLELERRKNIKYYM